MPAARATFNTLGAIDLDDRSSLVVRIIEEKGARTIDLRVFTRSGSVSFPSSRGVAFSAAALGAVRAALERCEATA